jgi:AraC-like DNA-binding protein
MDYRGSRRGDNVTAAKHSDATLAFAGMDDDATTGFPVVGQAAAVQFSPGGRLAFPRVESRFALHCVRGRGTVAVDGVPHDLTATTILLVHWGHAIEYLPDKHDPFLVRGLHLIPWHASYAPIELSIPHRLNHPLAGVPWRRDNPTLGAAPVLRTDDRHRLGLALLIQYAAGLWQHALPGLAIGRALGALAVSELSSPEQVARHDDPRLPVELRRLLRWIDDHLADQITVAKLADIAGCSPTSVNRLFRRHLHAAPMGWVIARRIDRARELLSRTHLAIAEVARQSGLADPYYFSRLFKIRTGVPPREWRRQFSAP